MRSRILAPACMVICALMLFTGVGYSQTGGNAGMDSWTRLIKAKSAPAENQDGFVLAMKRGRELEEAKRYAEAVNAFSEALRLNPQSSEAYSGRGNARRARKDFTGAMVDYREAVRLDPRNLELQITLANIKTDMRKYDEAVADLNSILTTDPNNLDAVISRGYARKQSGDYAGAKSDFQKALAIDSRHGFAARMLKSLESTGKISAKPVEAKPLPVIPSGVRPQVQPPVTTDLPVAVVKTTLPAGKRQNEKPVLPTLESFSPDRERKEYDPCKPDLNVSDLVWSTIEQPSQKAQKQTKTDSRFNDLLVFSSTRHNHPAATAKAQMAYLMGDLSPADQVKFDEKWSYFFRYPSDELTAYFEKLIPLLADLIETRNQTTSAVLAQNEALKDAEEAGLYENKDALANAEMIARQQKMILQDLEGRLKALAAGIEALGDPPNPLVNACKSRKKHEEARRVVKDAQKASIVPRKLNGKTGISYTFKPDIAGLPDNAKLSWDFGDGEVKEAPAGEVKHTFKNPGRFVVRLSLFHAATKEKVTVAEARALMITGSVSLSKPAGKTVNPSEDIKYDFITKDPLDVGSLPEGCKVVRNEGQSTGLVYSNQSARDYLYFWFGASVACKERILEQGQASLEHFTKPVPYKILAKPALVGLSIEYYPPTNILYEGRVESLSNLLENQAEMSRFRYAPYSFKGSGRIVGYESVKKPLSKGTNPVHHKVNYYGLGPERTTITFNIDTYVLYDENSFGISCQIDGRRCQNVERNRIIDKFRDDLREKLSAARVAYYREMENIVAGMRLKSLPQEQSKTHGAPAISQADLAWLNIDETGLTPEEIMKQKQEALRDAEKFYRSNVEILQKNLSREQADYAREQDPDRKAAFFFRMMAIKADIQAEQDKINTLHTGKIVHTRTQYDNYVQNKFIERIKEEQEKYVKLERAAAIIRKEAKKLPPGEREKAAEFIDKHITGKTLANLDEETVKKAGEAIFNKTQGYNEAEAAKYEEEAYMWDDYLTRAERVKMAADIGMIGCSFLGGPMALSSAYDISTGYFQGGIKEAATQLVLQTGAFALGKFAGAGSKAAAGADDAAAAAKTATHRSGKVSKGRSSAEELKIFQANRTQGEKAVRQFEELNRNLKTAYLNKASQPEITAIKKQIREKTVEIQANPHAKNFLKYQGDKLTQTRFTRSIRSVHKDVEKKFYEKMRKEPYKWGEFEIKEMRNASSSGSVGMDYDVGLIEKPNFIKLPDGSMKRQVWLTKDGKPSTRSLWQKDAQKCWNEAYEEVTLKNAERSWENLTTRIHPESYQDLAVLDGNLNNVSKAWIQQTSDVTRYKAMHMLKDGSMSKFEKLQEISRGTAKDLNTKLMPLLDSMTPTKKVSETAGHWKKVSSVLDDFGKNKIDPITAERRIAELTGGKSIPEVVDDMSYMMESIVKLGKKP